MTNINKNRQIISKLRLYRSENVGPVTYKSLLTQHSPEQAIERIIDMASRGGKSNLKIPTESEMEEELEKTEKMGGRIMDLESPEYIPQALHFPPLLTLLGREELLLNILRKSQEQEKGHSTAGHLVTAIGTRLPSLQGLQYTKYIVEYLGRKGITILSGFAKGIDTQAHEAAIGTGTIGFFPCGIDIIFPSVNYILYHRMKEEGLLITDRPLGQPAMTRNFPLRNRYMVLLSQALVVLESKINSGSIMTGGYALKYGIPILAVPGHPLDFRYGGNNQLIRNGASLLDHPDRILEKMEEYDKLQNGLLREQQIVDDKSLPDMNAHITDQMRLRVSQLLNQIPISLEMICKHTAMSLGEVNYIILEMELAGRVERTIDDKISLVHPVNGVYST